MDRILLIDGLNLIYKGKINFKSKQIEENKESYVVVYNFFRNLKYLIDELNPTKIFFCLESSNNFRKALSSTYKANRIIKTSSASGKIQDKENFFRQVNIIQDLISYLPITKARADGFECDDVINTLCYNIENEQIIVVSNDSDYIQIIQNLKNVRIYNPFKKEFFSIPKYHMLAFKCLNGDSSDNIKGMIGEKQAILLASNPNLLEKFLSSEENRANFSLNRQLIEFQKINLENLELIDYSVNFDKLKYEFQKMEFNSILKNWKEFQNSFNRLR